MKTICIFLATGFEEVEALMPLDILRRGGLEVKTISVTGDKIVCGAHNVRVVADCCFEELDPTDISMIVLPGGMPGAANLDAHVGLSELVLHFDAEQMPLAAICAAPMVFGKRGLLKGKKATCYPGFESYLEGAVYTGNRVETVGHFILGKGPGAAAEFGLAILAKWAGKEKAEEVRKGMLLPE